MAAQKFSNPFAPLNLTRDVQKQLEELAEMFVGDTISQYESYLHHDRRQVDASRWKFMRQKEDIRVFRERSTPVTTSQTRNRSASKAASRKDSFSSVSDCEDVSYQMDSTQPQAGPPQPPCPAASQENTSSLPSMLTVGTLVGDLYDAMYGVVNPTLDMVRIKTSYVEDVIVNAAVLASIVQPSLHDPFRSVTVKWIVKGQPLHIRTIVKNRDLVFLESTGLTRLPSTGETIGYQLLHSVAFPETTPLPGSLRGNMSLCALYRQHSDGVVDFFGKGFVDPTGKIMRALVIKSAADAMVTVTKYMTCSLNKKLAYALRRRHAPVLANSAFDERLQLRNQYKHNHHDNQHNEKQCGVCSKGLSSLAPLTFGVKSHGVQCRLCLQTVCSSCRIKKKLSSISPQDQFLYQQQITFCVHCVTAVTKTNALEIACDELLQKDAPRGYGGSITSSVSSVTFTDSYDENQHVQLQQDQQYHQNNTKEKKTIRVAHLR